MNTFLLDGLGINGKKAVFAQYHLIRQTRRFRVCVCVCCNVADDLLFLFAQHTLFLVTSLQFCFGELSHTYFLWSWYCQ